MCSDYLMAIVPHSGVRLVFIGSLDNLSGALWAARYGEFFKILAFVDEYVGQSPACKFLSDT